MRRTRRRLRSAIADPPDETLAALALAALAGAAAFVLAGELFPHHTTNHDEGVYLQQAAMLLEGRLALYPPVPEAMRPWFFVDDGGRLYPKYAPVPAAVFAAGEAAAGSYRASLSAVAAATVASTYALGAAAFDRRTGLAAAAMLAVSPLFLVQSAVFLPYLPTLALELAFALAYVRGVRRGSRRYAALAGVAIGLAFFARPYTAVLFAAPFVAHAGWSVWRSGFDRVPLAPTATTAAVGLAFVGLALGYNAAMTGSATRFPYEAFAPRDGLGFGERAILGYERRYTPAVAARATLENLRLFAVSWAPAAPLGVPLAVLGAVAGLRSRDGRDGGDEADAAAPTEPPTLTDRQLRRVLLGVAGAVALGNAGFWGTMNVLGRLGVPGDGLVRTLGPYYHLDLLLPVSVFAGAGLVVTQRWLAGQLDGRVRLGGPRGRSVAVAVALAVAMVAASGAAAAGPLAENAAVTADLDDAYAPFDGRELSGAVVLLPTPYGGWLGHPFQALRNDPGYDDGPVFAVDDGPSSLDVLAAFPDRTAYRYAYRGEWAPGRGEPVDARLQPVERVTGEAVVVRVRLGVPDGTSSGSLRVASGDDAAYAAVGTGRSSVSFAVRLTPDAAAVSGDAVEPTGEGRVGVDGRDELTVQVYLEGEGSSVSYRLRLPVVVDDGAVHTMTPAIEACRWPRLCGGESAYLPDGSRSGVSVEVALEPADSST